MLQQIVSVFKVYDEEIEKTYGGYESYRGYYSAAYSRYLV